MPKLSIDQIALCPANPSEAIKLLTELGAERWARDHVVATGSVFGSDTVKNEADLVFCYDVIHDKEFEVLHYTRGYNWMADQKRANSASHLGMHCTEDDLEEFRKFFFKRGIGVAQEVFTEKHTNPAIAGKRWYHYVIFDTKAILGIDIKFIVRRDSPWPQS